jgi:N6-adenosine-specific RNA methylase IME4
MSPYDIIYADPPWAYRNKKTGGSMISGAESKYLTMSVDEICTMPIKDIASKNSVLFLWATVPLMPEAFQVMQAWGYKYKTMITWRKIMSLGMGYWFRGQCEHLLLGVRGQVKAFRLQEPNFIQAKVLNHSQKPDEFRQLIERATAQMPSQNRIELFARNRSDGWDAFGNEVEGSIDLRLSNITCSGREDHAPLM